MHSRSFGDLVYQLLIFPKCQSYDDPKVFRDMVRVAMSVWDGSDASHPRDAKMKPRRRPEHPLV
jgi:hypothetical protein